MRFQITEDGKTTKYDLFSKAQENTGIKTCIIYRFLKYHPNGGKYVRRSDKKVFFIERVDEEKVFPLIRIDGEEFFSLSKVLDKFGLRETKFFNQLKKNHFGFLDLKGFPHKVDWLEDIFLDILNLENAKPGSDEAVKLQSKCLQKLGGKKARGCKVFG